MNCLSPFVLTIWYYCRNPSLKPESLVAGKDQGPHGQDYRDDRELSRELHVEQAKDEYSAHIEAIVAQVFKQQDRVRPGDDELRCQQPSERVNELKQQQLPAKSSAHSYQTRLGVRG